MSGHSKWSTIKRKKAALDSKRSQIFTKIIREITVAAREGGASPEMNARLRLALVNARKANVPKDVVERAINKSTTEGDAFVEKVYEGYAPGGVAVIVECATDNLNRTTANVRSFFNRSGGSLGTSGCVSYMFERKGIFVVSSTGLEEDDFTLQMIDAGADDVENEDGYFHITCPFEAFGSVNATLEDANLETEESNVSYIPGNTVELEWEIAKKVLKLIETLEENDDVQKVFHNLQLSEEIIQQLEAEGE